PELKHHQSPEQLAIIALARHMIAQKFCYRFGIEEPFAFYLSLLKLVQELLAQSAENQFRYRYAETFLFARDDLGRHSPAKTPLQYILGLQSPQSHPLRNGTDESGKGVIQKRRSGFERAGHAGAIDFE